LGGDGKGIVFRRPGEEEDGGEDDEIGPSVSDHASTSKKIDTAEEPPVAVADTPAIVIHDDD
jgi:hypothetical protein